MGRWIAGGGYFYARFQDDIILIAKKRHVLRRMKTEMYKILNELCLSPRFEKPFVERSQKGFYLLGYNITPQCIFPSEKTQERALEKARPRYTQGCYRSLQEYLNHWRNWAHAGFKDGFYYTVDIVKDICYRVTNSLYNNKYNTSSFKHYFMKGKSICQRGFSIL